MLKNIRSSIILGLVIINLIGFISFFITMSNYYGKPKASKILQYSTNYYNVKEKNASIYDNNKKNQTLNSNIIKNRPQKFEYTKNLNLRKLYRYNNSFSSFYQSSLLILNLIFLYFCLNLISSFLVGDNECQNCCCGNCDCRGDCNCSNSSGGNGGEILVCLILLFILIIIYFSTKLCGKHLSRYISLSFIIIINFSILIISLIYLSIDDDSVIKSNILISSILLICNALGISLPNCKKCENLTYKSKYPSDSQNINFPPYQLPEINNGIAVNNNNFGYYNNSQVTTNPNIPNYPIPVVSNGYIEYPQQAPNNVSLTNSTNNNSIDSSDNLNSQKLEYSGDMGIPPLPNQVLPSEKEVNSNSKI